MPLPEDLGVLLVAHGTVATLEELPDFLLAIRRGRPPTNALITEMKQRYEAIGGSPLLKSTEQQAAQLRISLQRPVYVGMRFCRPTIEAALEQARSERIARLIVLPMAPYSVDSYSTEVVRRLRSSPDDLASTLTLLTVEPWGNAPELIRAHSENISTHARAALDAGAKLMLTAHSLPLRAIEEGDTYAETTQSAARAIGDALKLDYTLGYQSVGADGGAWLGPSIFERLRSLAEAGCRKLVVAPFGFLCDHVETLYDLDIEFKSMAQSLGVSVYRVPALGNHPGLIRTMASLVMASWSRREKQPDNSPEGTTP